MQASVLVAVVAFAAAVSAQDNYDGNGCMTTCGLEVPQGWSGYGDGYNHCNRCSCGDGKLVCTKKACTDMPCPQDVCEDKRVCGGITKPVCGTNHVCLDDPADSCDGGARCGGCCLFDKCLLTKCRSSHTCELNTLGQPECVPQPTVCCRALPACPSGTAVVDSCSEKEFLTNICTQVSLCCTTLTCKKRQL